MAPRTNSSKKRVRSSSTKRAKKARTKKKPKRQRRKLKKKRRTARQLREEREHSNGQRKWEHRDVRCAEGFYPGLCTVPTCPHFDGITDERKAIRTLVHDAWGRGA